jgi:hypothetical protein
MRQKPTVLALVSRASLVSGLVVVSSFVSAFAACALEKRAIQMKQEHYFLGTAVVTAAKDGVRIENTGFKYIVVAKAPDWRVNIFRNDDKTYFSESLREFQDTGLVSDFLVSRREHYLPQGARSSPVNFLGHPAIRVTTFDRTVKYLPLDKETAQQVELVIYSTYKLYTCGGLPVEVIGTGETRDFISGVNNKGRRTTYLKTSTISSVNVSPEFFVVPKNYTKEKSVREVMAGADTRKESVDAQDLFETGRNKNQK